MNTTAPIQLHQTLSSPTMPFAERAPATRPKAPCSGLGPARISRMHRSRPVSPLTRNSSQKQLRPAWSAGLTFWLFELIPSLQWYKRFPVRVAGSGHKHRTLRCWMQGIMPTSIPLFGVWGYSGAAGRRELAGPPASHDLLCLILPRSPKYLLHGSACILRLTCCS